MPPDPRRVADTEGWLKRVESDLRAAEVDLAAVPALLGDSAFHSQQAVEKALKALLTWHDIPFRRTHDLAELGHQCALLDASIEPICRRAERLTAFAWVFRYPGDVEEPTRQEAEDALALAHEVHAAVLQRLPEAGRS
ncbi:MAG: HEPN domain-containing protein [Thermomicrobiales bacterium]